MDRDFAVGIYLSEAQNHIPTQGRGEGARVEPEGRWGNSSQNWVDSTNMTDCISSL
jgi:hypothetical protein